MRLITDYDQKTWGTQRRKLSGIDWEVPNSNMDIRRNSEKLSKSVWEFVD
jgi:hypothetical protein